MSSVLVTGLMLVAGMAWGQAADLPAGFQPTTEILISAGEFTMGYAEGVTGYEPHQVRLAEFFIDEHEVTNAQYLAFCEGTERDLPIFWGLERFRSGPDWPDHPVTGVSNGDAKAYAKWVGRRLPTEAEWEFAARGKLAKQMFDRGNELLAHEANTKASGIGAPEKVASFPPNGYGLYDMVGNVREWVSDYYSDSYFSESPVDNPQGPEKTKWRVIKGGGWHSGRGCNRVHVRNALPGGWSDFNVGFRCARDGEASPQD